MACYFSLSEATDAWQCPDSFDVMAPSFLAIAESMLRQPSSKWLWHTNHLASCLGISVKEAHEFIRRVQSGGTGVRKDGTWVANPAPCQRKIDLTKEEDNSLNLHLVESGKKHLCGSSFDEPSPAVIDVSSRCVRLGNLRSKNKDVTFTVQREIVQFVLGAHQTLIKHCPEIGV